MEQERKNELLRIIATANLKPENALAIFDQDELYELVTLSNESIAVFYQALAATLLVSLSRDDIEVFLEHLKEAIEALSQDDDDPRAGKLAKGQLDIVRQIADSILSKLVS